MKDFVCDTPWRRAATVLAAVAAFGTAAAQAAVTGGRTDSFEDGTTQSWSRNVERANAAASTTVTPRNVADGGPAGTGDAYLQIVGDGAGSTAHITAFNRDRWSGDFLAAGITRIELDLRNVQNVAEVQQVTTAAGLVPAIRTTAMQVRLVFSARPRALFELSPGVFTPGEVPQAWVTQAFTLEADDAWHHATFLLDPARMTRFAGVVSTNAGVLAADPSQGVLDPALTLPQMLASVYDMRIIHNPTADYRGQGNVLGTLGVDNIQAVPELGTLGMALLGLAGLGLRLRPARRA
jgi:hypothetical protein